MTPAKQIKTRVVEKADYWIYLKKGKEFYHTMFQAEKAENWNAVGLNGVHCVISLIDALLVKYSGIRSTGKDHMAAVDLLTSAIAAKLKGSEQKSRLARRVIAKKNLVEYENRDFSQNESLDLISRVQRFHDWIIEQL
jgi:hypothetical protein